MNIFLLSCTDNLNTDVSQFLSNEIQKRGNKVAYISSEPQNGVRPYYISTVEDYKAINKNIQVDYFDLSNNFSDKKLKELLSYGTIYLSGGNTYVFLDYLKRRDMYPILKEHLNNNGLIIGASAGSIVLTPSIDLAGDCDENTPLILDTSGLAFVDFEFYPHFTNETEQLKYLSKYKKNKHTKIYLCKNGSGIFYFNKQIKQFNGSCEFID